MYDMAKFSKKILINQVKRYDRERIKDMPGRKPFSTREIHAAIQEEKRSNYIRADELRKLIDVARGHALWLHMLTLKEAFHFTSKQLLQYRAELQSVYEYAIDDTSGGSFDDIVKYTVHGSPKDDEGSFGMAGYELEPFDPDGRIMDRIQGTATQSPLFIYKKFKRTYYEFQKSEVASMLVLHDVFGFRRIRLQRFIETLRVRYDTGIDDHQKKMDYLEKLCKTQFKEFNPIRHGRGIFDTACAEA